MGRRTLDGCRALVTGASSGIGREIARELTAAGARLVVTARRDDRLNQLVDDIRSGGGDANSLAGDITSEQTRSKLLDFTVTKLGGLDCLVNNAGLGAVGSFLSADVNRLRRIMEVNFFAPVELIRASLPILVQGNRPVIVNIGSVLGHCAVPNKAEYCASKFAIHGFNDALRAELLSKGVDVLLINPSTTDSEFFDRLIEGQGGEPKLKPRAMSPKRVAKIVVRAMRTGRRELILSLGGRLLVWCDRIVPTVTGRLLSRLS